MIDCQRLLESLLCQIPAEANFSGDGGIVLLHSKASNELPQLLSRRVSRLLHVDVEVSCNDQLAIVDDHVLE